MKSPTLLTTSRTDKTLVIVDGNDEIAAVFGTPKEQGQRAAELISAANYARLIRAKNINQKKDI